MTNDRQTRDDLSYVRSVVTRADGVSNPASIYFLWAAISFFGYAIIDFEPQKTGFYWMVAGPLGGVLSGILGARAARREGQISSGDGRVEMLHWTGLMLAVLLLVPLAATGRIATAELPRIILLLVALAYWSAGLREDRRMLPVAIVMAGLYLLTVFAGDLPYLWTITAAGLAASLAVAGALAAARARRAPR